MILEGKDLLARGRTGSGKTGAFAIPVINKILEVIIENYIIRQLISINCFSGQENCQGTMHQSCDVGPEQRIGSTDSAKHCSLDQQLRQGREVRRRLRPSRDLRAEAALGRLARHRRGHAFASSGSSASRKHGTQGIFGNACGKIDKSNHCDKFLRISNF